MVIVIRGVLGGADLSGFVDREAPFRVEAATGARMDTLTMTLFDKAQQLTIPARAEIIVYDYPAASLPAGWVGFTSPANPNPIIDHPTGGYYYDDRATYDTSSYYAAEPTPRLFAGYVAAADFQVTAGRERAIVVTAQDYTARANFTVCNRAYGPDAQHPNGWSDQQIVRDLFAIYAPDIDTTAVSQILAAGSVPTLSFPTHTLAQMMGRIIKLSQGFFRIDYFKHLSYGPVGYLPAPFDINADAPNGMTAPNPTTGAEGLRYSPDAANLINRVWVAGGESTGPSQTFTFPTSTWDGVAAGAVLPDKLHGARSVTVTINGVDQGAAGILGIDGKLDNRAAWSKLFLIGVNPPTIAFKTPPAAGATVVITGRFTYPLVQVVTDQASLVSLGIPWERVIKDRRIDSVEQATSIGNGFLALQKSARPQGQCIIFDHRFGNQGLAPGQSINITSSALFGGGVAGSTNTLKAFITATVTELVADTVQPFSVTVHFSDRPDVLDGDMMDHMLGEQARINAALEQSDVNAVVLDVASEAETVGTGAESLTVTVETTPYTYDGAAQWGYSTWG